MDASPLVRRHARVAPPGGLAAVTEPPAPLTLPPGPYELRIAGLRARWPDGHVITLGDADLLLPQGRRVAVLGGSRVDTSALAAVLLRLLAYQGTVTLNGVQLYDLSGADVRKVIGRCAQDAGVFDATLADNVRPARPGATDEEVVGALRQAGITLPPDTRVGEHGVSGGERQRIALARALLADVPILILSEPEHRRGEDIADTALTDLLTATEGRTLLLVTHRVALPGASRILCHVDEVVTLSGS